jgi:hypothetical protein
MTLLDNIKEVFMVIKKLAQGYELILKHMIDIDIHDKPTKKRC